jgi:hypothetical protein
MRVKEVVMTKAQRFRYEMFVRVRDFGVAQKALFQESSRGSVMFARVSKAVAEVEEHLRSHVVGAADARKVKATTRAAVFNYMKTIALAARRVTQTEPGQHPFRMPRRRELARELSTARAFIQAAEPRQAEFLQFGLPSTFLSDFRTLVDDLQRAVDVRLSSKTVRRQARAGVATAIARGFEAVRDLDAIVAIATLADPTTFAAWGAARRVEGQGASAAEKPVASTPAAAPIVPAPELVAPPAVTSAPGPTEVALHQVLGRAS